MSFRVWVVMIALAGCDIVWAGPSENYMPVRDVNGSGLSASACTIDLEGPIVPDNVLKGHELRLDACHVKEAIGYLKSGNEEGLKKMAALPAIEHLLRHARKFDYEVPRGSPQALARTLVQIAPARRLEMLERADRSLEFFLGPMSRDPSWVGDVLAYLPGDFRFRGELYLTFGYDIGVAEGDTASLNAIHRGFAEHPRELIYYAIHELHHTGFMAYHTMAPISQWKTFADLHDWVLQATQMEGMAVWAAYARRKREGALEQDVLGDYVALDDEIEMARLEKEYRNALASLDARGSGPVSVQDREAILLSFGRDRLLYRVGAHMARKIEAKKGRSYLIELIKEGPGAFRKTYLTM